MGWVHYRRSTIVRSIACSIGEELGRRVAAGEIVPETLVWHEGLAEWTPYGRVAAPTASPHTA